MKILIVTQYFWPESFLINGLVEDLHKRGHEVEVLTGLPNYPKGDLFQGYNFWTGPFSEMYREVAIHRVPLVPRKKGFKRLFLNYVSYVFFASLFGFFKIRKRPDVIFCYAPSPATSCLPAIVLKWIYRRPLVFWVQDLWPESLEAVGATRSKMILQGVGRVIKFIYSQCDRILIQSEAFTDSVLTWGARKDKIKYLPNWAPPLVLSEKKIDWLTGLPTGFKIVFAGNVGKAQDMPTLLKAAQHVKTHYPAITDLYWIVVGDGSERFNLETDAKKLGLEKTILTFGQRPNEDMAHLFAEAEVLLVLLKDESIFSLTVPAKIQSYMSSGKPILAAINGEGARIVEKSGAGLTGPAENFVTLAENAVRFYKMNSSQRASMGHAGHAFFNDHFTQPLVVQNLIQIFNEQIQKSSEKPL